MKLRTVTITGADDSISPTDLVVLTQKYPFVEWALLLSSTSIEGPCRFPSYRFPSLKWLKELSDNTSVPLQLSGHFCGTFVTDFIKGKLPELDAHFPPWLWQMFQRIQINFHGVEHAPKQEFYSVLPQILKNTKKQYIFQADNVNEDIFWGMQKRGVDAVPLFDLSHGAGVLPENWPDPLPGIKCGYAGGLGPDNLEAQIQKIASKVGEHEIWIDMETNVRSNADKLFDLKKVEKCLEIARPFISG